MKFGSNDDNKNHQHRHIGKRGDEELQRTHMDHICFDHKPEVYPLCEIVCANGYWKKLNNSHSAHIAFRRTLPPLEHMNMAYKVIFFVLLRNVFENHL